MTPAAIIDALIEREGPYVNHPNDKGGPTAWGITEAVARAWGYKGAMADLPRSTAVAIYADKYIKEPGFDRVLPLSEAIGTEMVDTGVNMGASLPGPWLQRILNVLNQQARTYPDLVVDGQLGPATIAALKSVLRHRGPAGEKVIVRALNCLQGARYLDITEKREANESFFYGWMLNRVEVV